MKLEQERAEFEAALGRGKTYTERDYQMYLLGRRAAIEADRKRRGEPIANLWVNPETLEFEVDSCNHPIDELIPVYEAPQPAEPVNDKPFCFANINKQGDVTRTSKKRDGWAKTPLYLQPQPAEPVKVPTNAQIREVFLANGFTIKPGHDDLKPYVYEAARDLLARYGNVEENENEI